MFFFLAGGVTQEVRRVLKSGAGRCVRCDSSMGDLVEYDKVLNLFFVPVWRWPGKAPLMHCNNCNIFFPQSLSEEALRCSSCDRSVDRHFSFCPFCGSTL